MQTRDFCRTADSGNSESDALREVRFREAARQIVAKDRYNRKHGMPVDTAGAIARYGRAYRQGFLDAQAGSPGPFDNEGHPGKETEWALIPPRPRAAFWTICLFTIGKGERRAGEGHLSPAITGRGTPGWKLTLPARDFRDKPFREKTLAPLVRLGLLELANEPSERLIVSERGTATWFRFLDRGGDYPDDLTQI